MSHVHVPVGTGEPILPTISKTYGEVDGWRGAGHVPSRASRGYEAVIERQETELVGYRGGSIKK